jgi:hypothetical protein
MIPFDMRLSFIVGQPLALSARRQLTNNRNLLVNRPLMISLLWMSLIYVPASLCGVPRYMMTDWMSPVYITDWLGWHRAVLV